MMSKVAIVCLIVCVAGLALADAEFSRESRVIAARQAELVSQMQDKGFKVQGDGTALDCDLFGNCQEVAATSCLVNGCSACYSGYSNYCAVCASGYTRTSNYQCAAKCTVPNCATCYSGTSTMCWQCYAGYVQTSTYQCDTNVVTCNVPNCSTCSAGSSTQCSICNTGYTRSSTGQCTLACSAANCAACVSGSATQCQTCNSGYTLSNGQCVTTGCTVPNCNACYSGTSVMCWQCASGYSQTSTYQCAPNAAPTCQVSACTQCVSGSSTQCAVCQSGYSLTTSKTCTPSATAGTLQAYITKDLSAEYTLRAIENQGQCGSCASFATAHTVNDNLLTSGKGCANTPLSEQYIVDCLRNSNPMITNYCSTGATMRDLWNFWSDYGSTSSSCVAYHAAVLTCPSACDGGQPFPFKAKTPSTCVTGVAAMQAALNAGHTLAIGVQLQAQFQTDYAGSTFACNNIYPHAGGASNIIGGHAMEVVGYGTYNGQTFWKLKNSWGTGWGCHGFVYMAAGQPAGNGQTVENAGACYSTPSSCIAASPFETSAKEVPFSPDLEVDPNSPEMLLEQFVKFDASELAESGQLGGSQPVNLNDPLVQEAATFAAEILLALPKAHGGFECVENVNNSFHPTGNDDEASMINVEIYSGDQQLVGGQLLHVVFGFTTTDKRCAGAAGSFDATVHVDPSGRLILQDVKSASVFPSKAIPWTLIAEVAAPVGLVLSLAVTFFVVRWYRTRAQYTKLQTTHKELVRRVTILETDETNGIDAATRSRINTILGPQDDWAEYVPAPPPPRPPTPASPGVKDVEMLSPRPEDVLIKHRPMSPV